MELTRQYAKTCDLPDFSDPEIAPLITEIAPDLSAAEPHRKGWEFAMTALFLRDAGVLRDDAAVLDIGAGSEPILFWLANRVGRVVAGDIYGRGGFGEREATRSFIDDPPSFAPYDYPHDRLEVEDMDARSLALRGRRRSTPSCRCRRSSTSAGRRASSRRRARSAAS